MQHFMEEVVSIADACLGGLRGRSALLVGPEEQRQPYRLLLQQAGMKYIYQEDTYCSVSAIIPQVQLLMNLPVPPTSSHAIPRLTAQLLPRVALGVELHYLSLISQSLPQLKNWQAYCLPFASILLMISEGY